VNNGIFKRNNQADHIRKYEGELWNMGNGHDLVMCEAIFLQIGAAEVVADAPTVDETLPIAGDAVTIIVTSGADGTWMAIGY
jgi:hypothetical protein